MFNVLAATAITGGFMAFLGVGAFVFEWVRFIVSTMLEERREGKERGIL